MPERQQRTTTTVSHSTNTKPMRDSGCVALQSVRANLLNLAMGNITGPVLGLKNIKDRSELCDRSSVRGGCGFDRSGARDAVRSVS